MENKQERYALGYVTKTAPEGENSWDIEFVCSTSCVDRQGEIVDQKGWLLDNFRKNPGFLAGHQHRLADGRSPVLGSFPQIGVENGELVGRVKFSDDTELGKEYRSLYRDGHMRAVSVGFAPIEGAWEEKTVGEKKMKIWRHTKQELLEVSAVAVGANTEALARMRALALKAAEPDVLKSEIENLKSKIENLREEILNNLAAVRDGQAQVIEMLTLSPESMHDHAEPVVPGPADGSSHRGDGYDKGTERLAAAILAALKPSNN